MDDGSTSAPFRLRLVSDPPALMTERRTFAGATAFNSPRGSHIPPLLPSTLPSSVAFVSEFSDFSERIRIARRIPLSSAPSLHATTAAASAPLPPTGHEWRTRPGRMACVLRTIGAVALGRPATNPTINGFSSSSFGPPTASNINNWFCCQADTSRAALPVPGWWQTSVSLSIRCLWASHGILLPPAGPKNASGRLYCHAESSAAPTVGLSKCKIPPLSVVIMIISPKGDAEWSSVGTERISPV
mmetsp:Transcript_81363/g.230946  ORF Transcript_81363/g.230946 Transcript_81363/m.230946 type:complete len:244 (+) Transcript_81363:102-833(+)